ncbi:hypothetical protein ABZ128_07245 [Streptomyces sp. NPDC006326]|uniref:hypothetical protein n=1 Tax=Streptomyces sp. NPDC006326 TaxID=3156752 RepID=UPI0033BF947C
MEKTTPRPAFRTRREQLRNGGRGSLIGTAFGVMWFALGQSAVGGSARPAVLVVGLVPLAASIGGVIHLFRAASRTPAGQQGAPVAPGGDGPRFMTVVIIEAIVLGVGNNYVRTGLDRPELMLSWSALVVGAHFFPLARTLRAPMLRVVGGLMIATVPVAALASLVPGATDAVWQAVPGLGCAAVLWAGAAYTAVRAGRTAQDAA